MHRPNRPSPRHRASSLLLAAGLIAATALSACSASDASTRADADSGEPTTTAAQVTVPETIPAGTTLRIGDQLDYLKTVLAVAGRTRTSPTRSSLAPSSAARPCSRPSRAVRSTPASSAARR